MFGTAAVLTVLPLQEHSEPVPTPGPTEEPAPTPGLEPTPAPTEEPAPSSPGMDGLLAVVLAGALLAGAGAAAQATRRARRRRAADDALAAAFAEPPDVFAQRIVDELSGEQEDGGKPPFESDRTT